MPMFKIYVGNLDPRVKLEQVRELFSPFATIEDAVLVVDTETAKPKGFAIIMIRDAEIGRAAVKATQGKRLLGKTLTINEVMKKGKAAAKSAKEQRQGPFGPHFNRQGGSRAGAPLRGGGLRRGMNRGPRGPGSNAGPGSGFGSSSGGYSSSAGSSSSFSSNQSRPSGSSDRFSPRSSGEQLNPQEGGRGASSTPRSFASGEGSRGDADVRGSSSQESSSRESSSRELGSAQSKLRPSDARPARDSDQRLGGDQA